MMAGLLAVIFLSACAGGLIILAIGNSWQSYVLGGLITLCLCGFGVGFILQIERRE